MADEDQDLLLLEDAAKKAKTTVKILEAAIDAGDLARRYIGGEVWIDVKALDDWMGSTSATENASSGYYSDTKARAELGKRAGRNISTNDYFDLVYGPNAIVSTHEVDGELKVPRSYFTATAFPANLERIIGRLDELEVAREGGPEYWSYGVTEATLEDLGLELFDDDLVQLVAANLIPSEQIEGRPKVPQAFFEGGLYDLGAIGTFLAGERAAEEAGRVAAIKPEEERFLSYGQAASAMEDIIGRDISEQDFRSLVDADIIPSELVNGIPKIPQSYFANREYGGSRIGRIRYALAGYEAEGEAEKEQSEEVETEGQEVENITTAEVGEQLGLSAAEVRDLIYGDELEAEKIGNRWYIDADSLADYDPEAAAPDYLSTSGAGEQLEMTPAKIRDLIYSGDLTGEKVGGRWQIDQDSFDSYLDSLGTGAGQQPEALSQELGLPAGVMRPEPTDVSEGAISPLIEIPTTDMPVWGHLLKQIGAIEQDEVVLGDEVVASEPGAISPVQRQELTYPPGIIPIGPAVTKDVTTGRVEPPVMPPLERLPPYHETQGRPPGVGVIATPVSSLPAINPATGAFEIQYPGQDVAPVVGVGEPRPLVELGPERLEPATALTTTPVATRPVGPAPVPPAGPPEPPPGPVEGVIPIDQVPELKPATKPAATPTEEEEEVQSAPYVVKPLDAITVQLRQMGAEFQKQQRAPAEPIPGIGGFKRERVDRYGRPIGPVY